jgi:hypothetical protein
MAKTTKKKEDDKITPFEQQFVDVWFRMNFNAKLAYKSLKPNVSMSTAETEGPAILRKPQIQEYIEMKKEHIRLKEEVELGWIIKELKDIVFDINANDHTAFDAEGKPLNKTDHRAKIEAIKTLAKITGLEAPKKVDVTTNGESLNLKDLINFKPTNE